jgi:hypothetical protein
MQRKHWLALGMALLLGLASLTSGLAQDAGNTVVSWWVISGGGHPAGAAVSVSDTVTQTVTLNGTLGQAITDVAGSRDGQTVVRAGYWTSTVAPYVAPIYLVFIPVVKY